MANLINNYIANRPAATTYQIQEQPKKPMPDFDIQRELDNRTFIKPLHGKGRLLRENIFNAPAIMVKDAIYDAKAFHHAAKGQANDHELGKLNDVGLKLGGLAIAAYLFTKKQTPMTKGMEFVGLASFLASMAIWPKLAIQLPAKLIHGVNVQQEYEDSFGRKKSFYQDPQFIPWDLYKDEEIQKIGDRLGVDKDIPNRRDFIQEKMKKLAIQNNTLWMLTAGFATPIMSALICNQTEPYLAKYLNNRQNKQADKILDNFSDYVKKHQDNTIRKNIEKIIELHKDKPVNKELAELITNTLTEGMDLVTAESFKADLNAILTDGTYTIDENTAKNVTKSLQKKLDGHKFSKEFMETVIPNEEQMIKLFRENNLFNSNTDKTGFQKIIDKIMLTIEDNVNAYNGRVPEAEREELDYVKKLIVSNKGDKHPIKRVLDKLKSSKLNSTLQSKLRHVANLISGFKAETAALDEYALKKVGSAPETVVANYWNNISKDLLKTFGITPKEIEKVRFDEHLMGALLREKFEKIASDKTTYDKVMGELIAKVAHLNSEIKPSDLNAPILKLDNSMTDAQKLAMQSKYDNIVDSKFTQFANDMKEAGFHKTARAVIGVNAGDNAGTLKNIQKSFVSDRLLGVKSSFYRLINTLDMYRRIATIETNGSPSINGLPREVKEELIELCKIVTLEGHSSDSATKFFMLRNPSPSPDTDPIEVKDGKVVNKYFGKAAGTTDIPGDKYFYQDTMKFIFEDAMHLDTATLSDNSIIKDEITKYRSLVLDNIGGEYYFPKPRHLIRPRNDNASSELKFLLTGIAPNELFTKAGQQAFNTRKWLKIFGGFGAGLLGVTVLAQFFLGKTKTPDKKVVKND